MVIQSLNFWYCLILFCAAIAKHLRMESLQGTESISHSSRGCKSKVKVSAANFCFQNGVFLLHFPEGSNTVSVLTWHEG